MRALYISGDCCKLSRYGGGGKLERLSGIHRQQKALLDTELAAEASAGLHRLRKDRATQRELLRSWDYSDDERSNDTRIVVNKKRGFYAKTRYGKMG